MKKLAVFLLLFAAMLACDEKKNDPVPESEFIAYIDGVETRYTAKASVTGDGSSIYYIIIVTDADEEKGFGMLLQGGQITETFTGPAQVITLEKKDNTGTLKGYTSGRCNPDWGSVTITEYNPATKRISGTFEADVCLLGPICGHPPCPLTPDNERIKVTRAVFTNIECLP